MSSMLGSVSNNVFRVSDADVSWSFSSDVWDIFAVMLTVFLVLMLASMVWGLFKLLILRHGEFSMLLGSLSLAGLVVSLNVVTVYSHHATKDDDDAMRVLSPEAIISEPVLDVFGASAEYYVVNSRGERLTSPASPEAESGEPLTVFDADEGVLMGTVLVLNEVNGLSGYYDVTVSTDDEVVFTEVEVDDAGGDGASPSVLQDTASGGVSG